MERVINVKDFWSRGRWSSDVLKRYNLRLIIISGNIIKQMNYGGIVLQESKWETDSLLVNNNRFIDFRPNYHPTAVGGYVIITDTYSKGIKRMLLDLKRYCLAKINL